MTKKCKNQFLEDDGFCTRCGQNHFKLRDATSQANRGKKVQAKERREATILEKEREINRAIEADPIFRTARDVARKILDDYGLNHISIIFRNCKSSSYRCSYKPGSNGNDFPLPIAASEKLVFGYQSLNHVKEKGFREYKTLQFLVDWKILEGKEGAHQMALHESAHAIDANLNGMIPGSIHGNHFMEIYRELIKEYPFEG